MKNFFINLINWFKNLFSKKVTVKNDEFLNADFPVVNICSNGRVRTNGFTGLHTRYTKWEDFKNKITWFGFEEDAFMEWKNKYYPNADVNTIEDYRKNWKKYRYQIWGCRVLNVSSLPHDPNFPVLYCIIDTQREVDSNRLSDDIRHWYIDFIHKNFTESEISEASNAHKLLSNNAHWQQNVNPTRRTIKKVA